MAVKLFKHNRERGFGIVELLVSTAIIGIVAVIYLTGQSVGYKTIFRAVEIGNAHRIAQLKMEQIIAGTYDYSNPIEYEEPSDTPATGEPFDQEYTNYTFSVAFDVVNGQVDMSKIQKVTVTVKLNGVLVRTLERFKVDRF